LPTFVGLKVIGKALMLDEIINYVQSLQRQVEVRAHLLELPLMPWGAGFKILINSTVPLSSVPLYEACNSEPT
jgi:hypothetical protein